MNSTIPPSIFLLSCYLYANLDKKYNLFVCKYTIPMMRALDYNL